MCERESEIWQSKYDVIQVFWYSKMEENYFSYYLLKVIENDKKYMFQEKKSEVFFFLKCNFFGSLFIRYSFTLSHVAKAFYYETFCEKNEQKKKSILLL